MRSQVTVTWGEPATYRIDLEEVQPMPHDLARSWLDEQFTFLGCEPIRPTGKVLTADKLLGVAEAVGEERFRDVEESVIDELTQGSDSVLSTGGGSVLRAANRTCLHERSHVVYLRSSPEEVFRRLRHDRNRPLLQVADPLQRLRDLFAQRDPLYREAAHFVIETGRPSVSTLVNMIVMQLELAGVVNDGSARDQGSGKA